MHISITGRRDSVDVVLEFRMLFVHSATVLLYMKLSSLFIIISMYMSLFTAATTLLCLCYYDVLKQNTPCPHA